jgi:hypothetical protein
MSYLLIAFLVYLAYRFITGFVVPVVRTTSQVKQQFRHMREQMQQTPTPGDSQNQSSNTGSQKPKYDVEGEYIPFEEVK